MRFDTYILIYTTSSLIMQLCHPNPPFLRYNNTGGNYKHEVLSLPPSSNFQHLLFTNSTTTMGCTNSKNDTSEPTKLPTDLKSVMGENLPHNVNDR
jgi:hypothetical protein